MNSVQGLLRKVLRIETAHPPVTILIAFLLAALSVVYTMRNLEFQTGQLDLISPENRLVKLSEKIDSFDKLDTFAVAIEGGDHARSLQFLHALVPRLKEDRENYLQVFDRMDPELFKHWGLFYLDKKNLLTLQENLRVHRQLIHNIMRSPDLPTFFAEINHEMASSMVEEIFTNFLDEKASDGDNVPLDLHFLIRVLDQMKRWLDGNRSFTSPWEDFFTGKSWDEGSEEGYFWTQNKRYLMLFVTPRKQQEGFSDGLHSLTALRNAIVRVQVEFPDVKAGVTGQEALNQDEMGVALQDMSRATLISLGALMLLLVLFWRGFRRPILEMIALVLALSWTFGLTTLFIGHLNILSVTFAPLLLGLGIDYGIHWFARYQEEEMFRGASKMEASETTMITLGPGILLAGLSAALSFFPLVFTGFKGLVELGLITSMGMVVMTVTTLCVLPALSLMFDKPEKPVNLSISSRGQIYLLKLTHGKALALFIPSAIALGFSLWAAKGVSFDLNMLHLQSKRAESVIWEQKLLRDSRHSSMYGAVLAHSLEEVRKKTAALEALPTVSEVRSVESLLPKDQEEKVALLRQMTPLIPDNPFFRPSPHRVNPAELETILSRIRFKMLESTESQWGVSKPLEAQMIRVRGLIEELRQRFQAMGGAQLSAALSTFQNALMEDMHHTLATFKDNLGAEPMRIEDLPKTLVQRFVGQDNLYLIRVFPAEDIWDPAFLGRFVNDLSSVDPEAIGDPVTLYIFTKAFRDASFKAAIYAVVFISILLLFTLRSFVDALLVMMPLGVGTAWTMGVMRLFGVDLNLANSIFLPLVVGAGIEYGIILMQRWRQQGGNYRDDVRLPLSTVKGIILAGLTTTVGFGSLTIADHQGICSLGLLAMVGSLNILAAAILFLPAFLQVLTKGGEKRRFCADFVVTGGVKSKT